MSRGAALWSVIVCAICLLAPPALAASRVRGIVVDAETQQPVRDAEVELANAGGGQGYFRTRTDARGEFAFAAVPAERYYLFTVAASGYTEWALEGWQFPAAQRDLQLTIPLERAGTLQVRTTTADGRTPLPAARVTVRAERGGSWWEARARDPEPRWSDRDGGTVFEGLPAGLHTVTVEAGGFRSTELRRVPVRRGEVAPLAVVMTRPASVTGAVRLADSTGVAGVTVVARGPVEATATTDARGEFALTELAPGRYRVEVLHDGLEPGLARDGVVVREGESRELGALRATPRPASFAFVLEREVFAAGAHAGDREAQRQQFGLRAFRVAALDLVLYRIPVARLLDSARDFRALAGVGADTAGLERVEAWRFETPVGPPFAWRETEMALPREQAPGAYLLVGRAGRLERRQVFFVSDLSLVVKRSATQLLVWAGSLRTGVPVHDARVFAVGGPADAGVGGGRDWDDPLAAARGAGARTAPDGLARLAPGADATRLRVVAISDRHGVAVAEAPLAAEATRDGTLFLFTERPLYRPGQSVYWKAVARRTAGEGHALPDRTRVTLTLTGPGGATVEVPEATLSASGTADGEVRLPAEAPLGEWTLQAQGAGAAGSAALAVQQYRKPEFEVTVTPDRTVAVGGDALRFAVGARYFFGAAVVGATVRWTLFESRLARDADPWADGWEGESEGAGYGRLLESGESRTDVDGRVALAFTPPRASHDRRLSLEVEVLDGAQRQVSARGSVVVGRGLFTLRIEPQSRMVMAGQPVVADLVTLDHGGRPVSAAVTLQLDQDTWNLLERRYTRASRPLASVSGQTSALQGLTRATITPASARSGYLQLRARAEDARGNLITAETGIWVVDERSWGQAYRHPSLEALPDRDAYAPGDTARILVHTDVRDAAVLVSVEGRELHEARVQYLFGQSGLVRVPVRASHGPQLFVSVHVRRGREVHGRVLELPIRTERHDLAITVVPDREEYRPRETASVRVETRDRDGRPVPAEVALAVVDEALYALRADATPRAHDVFYGRRPNRVLTTVSFPALYFAGADKGEGREPRRDFRDLALWAPTVRTDAAGQATVPVTWPDNLTTWRLTARGATDATAVGESVARTRVSQPLLARLAPPRQWLTGDEVDLVSIVTNRTPEPQTGVREQLEVDGAVTRIGAAEVTSALSAGGESRSLWRLRAGAPARDGEDARARITLRVRGRAGADALEVSVPVRPRTVPLALSGAATAPPGAPVRLAVALPADLVRTGSTLTVTLASGPAGAVRTAARALLAYPYGCTEQAANAVRATLALERAARRAGVATTLEPGDRRLVAARVQRLVQLRRWDGVWGWWAESDPDPFLTVLAAEALAWAAAEGVEREAALHALEGLQWSLARVLQGVREPEALALSAAHLAAVLEVPEAPSRFADLRLQLDAIVRSVHAQRAALSPAGAGLAALAAARLGLTAEARVLLDQALAAAEPRGDALAVPAAAAAEWYGDGDEATAFALQALARIAPADPRGDAMVRGLVASRVGPKWRSTRVSGAAAVALAEWLGARPESLRDAGMVTARLGDRVLHQAGIGAPFGDGVTLQVPAAALAPGATTLTVEGMGPGAVAVAWAATAQVPSPGPATDPTRLAVRREYLRATRVADRRGRPRWLARALEAGEPLRVGEAVMVRLTLVSPQERRHLVIEDPLAAGFEVDAVLPEGGERPWDTTGEVRDDRVVLFVGTLPAGESVIEYLVRPELAGTVTALPPRVEALYDPGLRARGGEDRVQVAAAARR